jgi:hypothetical protein
MTIKLFLKFIGVLFVLYTLNSCGIYRPTDAREYPPEPEKRVKKNMDEGRGTFQFMNKKDKGGVFDFATSNEMWRATLDTLDFMPLLSVDYGGGLIITDWYNDTGSSDESIKISVRFLTNEVRSDALKIQIFKKKCTPSANCTISENNSTLNSDLKLAILKQASIYLKIKNAKRKKRDIDTLTKD